MSVGGKLDLDFIKQVTKAGLRLQEFLFRQIWSGTLVGADVPSTLSGRVRAFTETLFDLNPRPARGTIEA
ncbi:Hypothetical protein SMAX5B_015785 [Scophthalmus maximus]|uniref:Uncharacterized protein n=1 Tax=Scophthalmus maximus TaxID=52904 RepID=A0A2U9CXL2_SCOMX|nr:Hypothetical protein SMAX5B_015785 [Scophthalmus maximus]